MQTSFVARLLPKVGFYYNFRPDFRFHYNNQASKNMFSFGGFGAKSFVNTKNEDWQTKFPTIRERNELMFNNPLLSDVKFILHEENGDVKTIPAHKYVLAISSPVFFLMFNNEFTEKDGNVEITDSDSTSFLAMLKHIYSDSVLIADCEQALKIWYLASKYFIPSLSEKCVSFLKSNVGVNDVLDVLAVALKFEEEALQKTCWEIIDFRAKTILNSQAFEELDRMILIEIFKHDDLRVDEITLVKSLDRWAQRKCEMTNAEKTFENKRQIIGEDLLSLVRFPASDEKKFAQEVLPLNLLTPQEVIDIFKHFNSVQVQNMVFPTTPRKEYLDLVFLNRFDSVDHGWVNERLNNMFNIFIMSVDRPITLCGFSVFGTHNEKYAVNLTVSEEESPNIAIARCQGNFTTDCSISISGVSARVFNCLFDQTPILLEKFKKYRVRASIAGPDSYFGKLIQFSLTNSPKHLVAHEYDGGKINFTFEPNRFVDSLKGQIPRVIFKVE